MFKSKKNIESGIKTVEVKNINFTQNSVAEHFDNGQSLLLVTQQLIRDEIQPETFPPMRIVKHMGQWWSLDNRRLRVFKDAFVVHVSVMICSFDEPTIRKEYFAKKTNKSLEGGGEIRLASLSALFSTKHFEEGNFVFTKKVLNWDLEQLDDPLPQLVRCSPLPSCYYSRTDYFTQFLDLILEDARASLQAQLAVISSASIKPTELLVKQAKLANKFENPSTLTLQKDVKSDFHVKSGDVILLKSLRYPDLKLMALATYKKEEIEAQHNIQAKVVIDQMQRILYSSALEEDAQWNAWHLGSLITYMRMYDVCTAMPQVLFEQQLLTGDIDSSSLYGSLMEEFNEITLDDNFNDPEFEKLNSSQQKAIKRFLRVTQGIELIEGPPGTGKTTTLVMLLKLLLKRGERILVSAPSNKAVQVIAEQFMKLNPNAPAVLVGIEEKLPDDPRLQRIFIHTWGEQIIDKANMLVNQLWELLPEKITEENTLNSIEKLKDISQSYLRLIKRLKLYQLIDLTADAKVFIKAAQDYQALIVEMYEEEFESSHFQKQGREFLTQLSTILNKLMSNLQRNLMDDSQQGLEARLLNGAKIIFATLSVAGRKSLKEMNPVKTLIVDEAAQAVEPEILIGFFAKPQKLLLIGDTNQLPATVFSPEAKQLKYDRSLMSRLIKDCKQTNSLLTIQHRMHPKIRQWPSKRYYKDLIEDHESVKKEGRHIKELEDITFLHPYSFIDLKGKEEKYHYSFVNPQEIQLIETILNTLDKTYKIEIGSRVGIITFYKGQMEELNKQFQPKYAGIKIQTVDGFQGGECDFVIISFVRANLHGGIGFLNDFRRLNVALTRARYSLIMVGNAETLAKNNDDLEDLIQHVKKNGHFFKGQYIQAFLVEEEKKLLHKQQIEKIKNNVLYKTQLCTFFSNKDSCEKGNTCDFAHGQGELKKSKKASLSYPAKTVSPIENIPQKTASTFASNTNRKPCTFFNGNPNSCYKGNKCNFEHVTPSNQ